MNKAIYYLVVTLIIAALVLGVYWVLWSVWCWVMPQVWEGGPKNIIAPGYWLFAACWCMAAWIGKAIFGGSSK